MKTKQLTNRIQGVLALIGAAIVLVLLIGLLTSQKPTDAVAAPEPPPAPAIVTTPSESHSPAPTDGPLTGLVVQPVLKRSPTMNDLKMIEGMIYGQTNFNVMDFELPAGCAVTDIGKTYASLVAFQPFPSIPVDNPSEYVSNSEMILTNVRIVPTPSTEQQATEIGAHFVADARLVPKDGKIVRNSDDPLYMDAQDVFIGWGTGRNNDPLVSCSII